MEKTPDETRDEEAPAALSYLRELEDEQLEVLAQQLDVAAVQVVVVAIPAPGSMGAESVLEVAT